MTINNNDNRHESKFLLDSIANLATKIDRLADDNMSIKMKLEILAELAKHIEVNKTSIENLKFRVSILEADLSDIKHSDQRDEEQRLKLKEVITGGVVQAVMAAAFVLLMSGVGSYITDEVQHLTHPAKNK